MSMTAKTAELVRVLSPRRRLADAPRRLHQAVARAPPTRSPPVSRPANDNYLHALYDDLMVSNPPAARTSQPIGELQAKRLNTPSQKINVLLAEYARQGNTRDFELSMSRMLSAPPTEHQRDLHVKAHIVHSSHPTPSSLSTMQQFPTSALAVLHQYEASGHFAPIKSYTRAISALFNVQACPSSDPRLGRAAAQAQAWDLFAHMRYVAHPVPDAHLYTLMIRACGSFSRPEPERALDLWMEMQQNGIKPTRGAYEVIIRVCGRAGPEWLGEGTRLAREMSDQYPITGANGRGLWCALLEGCKRAGDLEKARWILAEAVRASGDGGDSMVDAELMTHMFHTYASYKPPFSRETTRLIDRSAASSKQVPMDEQQTEGMLSQNDPSSRVSVEQTQGSDVLPDASMESVETVASFSRVPPQTSSEVITETRALFHRILEDRSLSQGTPRSGSLVGRFAHLELTPVLLNAYLSVFYRHASIETSQEIFTSLFYDLSGTLGLHPDEYSYVNALERCAIARAEERHVAARWAKDVWRHWEVTESQGLRDGKGDVGPFARLVEKAHAAMRRVLILSGDIDGALTLLRSFVSRYPPSAVIQPAGSPPVSLDTLRIATLVESSSKSATAQLFAKPPILSTRTVLTNPASSPSSTARPLVRLTSVVTPNDDRIPPVIGFSDVDLLHGRLVERGRIKDVGYIKWACMAYTSALKKRREAVLKAAPMLQGDEAN